MEITELEMLDRRTLGDLGSGDMFAFYPGGQRFCAKPDIPGQDEYVAVSQMNEIQGRYRSTMIVFDVVSAKTLRWIRMGK